jgi:hypothetical protein
MAYSSLLGGCCLRAAVQQHGRSGKVLRRPPEEWRGVSIDIRIDVRTLIGALVVVSCRPTSWWRWSAAMRLLGSRITLTQVTIPLMGLLLHGDVLCRSSVAGLDIHPSS